MRLRLLGREVDLVDILVTVGVELLLTYILMYVVPEFLKDDLAKAIVICVGILALIAWPIFYIYGPPWSSKKPQRQIALPLGRSQEQQHSPDIQPAKEPLAEPMDEGLSRAQLLAMWQAAHGMARRWEYAFLQYYLVLASQMVLDWLYPQVPPSLTWFHRTFPYLPDDERAAILRALSEHFLIEIVGEHVSLTPKGREYIEWRGADYSERLLQKLREEQKDEQKPGSPIILP